MESDRAECHVRPTILGACTVGKVKPQLTLSANAQAAHDAAMLDAIEDWKGAISTATLNSLVTSSNATRDYTNSLTEHWANWSVATAGKAGEAPTTPQASMVDSIIGILNPFDSVNAAEMVAPNNQANATPGSRRPNPSEINVVYSIYGIVSEHTPEEWEVKQSWRSINQLD